MSEIGTSFIPRSEARGVIPSQAAAEEMALRRVRRANYLAALAALYQPGSSAHMDLNDQADTCLNELMTVRQAQQNRNR
jgi:hypothetical protein